MFIISRIEFRGQRIKTEIRKTYPRKHN